MSGVAIKVEDLSKVYRIGKNEQRHETLVGSLASFFKSPLANFQRLRKLSRFDSLEEEDVIWALKDVSFTVNHGEAVGIIGRNGAGKSTLLKILSRITDPTRGRAEVYGRVASLLEVGTGFHPDLTGRENVYLNGTILGMKKREIDRKFDEIIEFSGVEKFIDTPVKRYSSGMRVRLAFSVAAHLEPEILIIDEVLAVGDMTFQKKCLGKMEQASGQGRTVIFVSHNMSAVTSLCSRAILLTGGVLSENGRSMDVVSTYLSDSLGASARAEWSDMRLSPGTDGFKLGSVMISDCANKSNAVVSVEVPIQVKLRYHVAESGLRFRCALGFYTQGTCAFTSMEPFETVREHPGWYCSTLEIPPNLLAEGEYTVSLSVFSSRGKKMRLCRVTDVVAFQVFDPVTGSSSRGDYTEGLAGVMRPMLQWRGEYIGAEKDFALVEE